MSIVRTFLFAVYFCALSFTLTAQMYIIALESRNVRLYMGYENKMMITIHPKDTFDKYVFHARAAGADVDYDDRGHLSILPYTKNGTVDIYAEASGQFYYAGQFRFQGVKPPPVSDGGFVEVMGITKENPKTKLRNKKEFNTTGKTILQSPKLYINGWWVTDLRPEDNLVHVNILLRGTETTIPQEGNIQILSADARIRKLADNTFIITPLPGKRKCELSYFLDRKQIGIESCSVLE